MKAIMLLSGGLDSAVLLYHLLERGYYVRCLTVNYGQRHWRELAAAEKLVRRLLRVDQNQIDLSSTLNLFGGSSQTDNLIPVPEGHYEEESMKLTVVPNRNMVLLSLATAWAVSTKSDLVAYAAHRGDHAIYPDCRPEFVDAMAHAVSLCDWHKVRLVVPFATMTKAEIVKEGARLGVPFELTYSCYKGGIEHCGKCGTCTERREAFQLAGVLDPAVYKE
jgi:7-cyano-7-deazaguanine synthase